MSFDNTENDNFTIPQPRRQQRNPFGDRNNFPSLDRAFAFDATDVPNSKSTPNTSICSHATNSLDMSIGARASLTEHWRHVAKYGVDGEEQEVVDPGTTPDVMWNQLLDTSSGVDISCASHADATPIALNAVMSMSADGIEAVEVSFAADTSCYSDYFNSSKVLLLATPEKNKNIERRVLSRKEEQEEEDESQDDDDANTTAGSDNFSHMFRAAMHIAAPPSDADGSFGIMQNPNLSAFGGLEGLGEHCDDEDDDADWGGVDVSRISAADSERGATTPLRGSPSRSFAAWLSNTGDTPTKQRAGPRFGTEHNTLMSPAKHRSSPSKASRRGRNQMYSHHNSNPIFSPPRRSPNVNTSFSSFLSPMEAQAAQMAGQMGALTTKAAPFPLDNSTSSSDNVHNSFVNLQPRPSTVVASLFDGGSAIGARPPSPISQANLSAIEFASMDGGSFLESSSSGAKHGAVRASPTSTLTPSPNEKSSCSSSRKEAPDRRHYRTVVPTRVFFGEPNELLSRDDSFSLPTIYSPSPEETDFQLFADNDEAHAAAAMRHEL
jgi:hypothetical protein